jgi:hypothetical protein
MAYRPDGTLLLLENRVGTLLALRDDGVVTQSWSFPSVWVQALRERRAARVAAMEARTGTKVYGAPLFKELSVHGDRALLLQPMPPLCMLMVDLVAATATPLRAGEPTLDDALCRAESAALTGSALVVAVNDSLMRFPFPATSSR